MPFHSDAIDRSFELWKVPVTEQLEEVPHIPHPRSVKDFGYVVEKKAKPAASESVLDMAADDESSSGKGSDDTENGDAASALHPAPATRRTIATQPWKYDPQLMGETLNCLLDSQLVVEAVLAGDLSNFK